MECVLDVRLRIGRAPQPFGVRLVLGEQQLARAVDVEPDLAEAIILANDGRSISPLIRLAARSVGRPVRSEARPLATATPRPRIPEPERGQELDRSRLRSGVRDPEPDQDVVRARLRVLDQNVEPAPVGKHARVNELVLVIGPRPTGILGDQVGVGERGLGVACRAALR